MALIELEEVKRDFLRGTGVYVAEVLENAVRRFAGTLATGYEDVIAYVIATYLQDRPEVPEWAKEILDGVRVAQFKQVLDKFVPQVGATIRNMALQVLGGGR